MLAVVPAAVARTLGLYVPIVIHEILSDVPHWPSSWRRPRRGGPDPGIRWLGDFPSRGCTLISDAAANGVLRG